MDCSRPGPPVPHHLPKFAQVHVHCVSDACHPAASSSAALFSFCPQSFPASGTFPMSWLFASDGQNTGASVLASVFPRTIQGWFPLRLTGLILLSRGTSGVFSSSIVQRHHFFGVWPSLWSSSHNHVTTGKTIALTIQPRSDVSAFQHTVWVCHHCPAKQQLSSDLMAAVTICSDFGVQEGEICHYFHLSLFYLPWSNGAGCRDLSFFKILSLKPALSLSSFTLIKRFLSSSSLSATRVVSSALLRLLMLLPPIWFQLVTHPAWHFSWWALCVGWTNRVTAASPVVRLSLSWTDRFFHTGFWLLLPDPHAGFPEDR